MKNTKLFTATALAAALLFSACNKTELDTVVDGTAIVFTATVDGGWEGVNSVAVMIDGTVKEYSVTVSDSDNTSATLSSDDPHYWTGSDDISVTAWWPYTEGETIMPDVVVQADQSTSDGFVGSVFISAEDQAVSYSNPTLTFTRHTARVTVILTDYIDGLESVKLTGLSTENGNPAEIVSYEYDNFTYVAHVVPQTVVQGTAFIACEFDLIETFICEMQSTTEWKAGEDYTYTVSLAEADPGYTYDESTNTYTVYKANGLLAWNHAVQDDLSLNCTLSDDINLTGIDYEWWVGDEDNPYIGTFEGGDYTITGLTVNKSETYYVGLIGVLGINGKVQNLKLENVGITGYIHTGGVVGQNEGTVTACSVSGSVTGFSNVGGVVGYNNGGTVTDCSVSGSVYSSGTYCVGGVVGLNRGTVTNCSVSGSVSGNYEVGGVVGLNYDTVTACTASGNVSGSGSCIGGVVGYNNGTVTACYSTGSVSGNYDVGGVVGYNSGGTVTACYHASGEVSRTGNSDYVGGVVGRNISNGTVTACYWSDYNGSGTGNNSGGTVDATEVDGSYVTWADAVEGMNAAIDTWNTNNSDSRCEWKYELTGDLPTLTKNE